MADDYQIRLLHCRAQALKWAIELFELTPEKFEFDVESDQLKARRFYIYHYRAALVEVQEQIKNVR